MRNTSTQEISLKLLITTQSWKLSIKIHGTAAALYFSSYPNGTRILDEFLQLGADNFLVLFPVSFKKDAFAKLPGPSHGWDVLNDFLCVAFAVLCE